MNSKPGTVAAALHDPALDPVDARVLLMHALGTSHAALIAWSERALDGAERQRFEALRQRRLNGEPVAYLVGWREFYGRRFVVDASVLIPRPETEHLLDFALARMPDAAAVLDLGTGSGNIALTLSLERPDSRITAVDASAAALGVARANMLALGAVGVEWIQGDWFEPLAGRRFDLIVSNPPYVAAAAPHLRRGDLRFEPPSALRAGTDGLDSIRSIVAAARRHLEPGGWLLFEHGFDQAEACRALLAAAGFRDLVAAVDLAQVPRVSGGRN